jgi:hypothetical protein
VPFRAIGAEITNNPKNSTPALLLGNLYCHLYDDTDQSNQMHRCLFILSESFDVKKWIHAAVFFCDFSTMCDFVSRIGASRRQARIVT